MLEGGCLGLLVDHHRGDGVRGAMWGFNQKNLPALCCGLGANLCQGRGEDRRGRRGRDMHIVLAGGRGLYELVGGLGPRVVDNLQEKNKHHPFEKGRGVRTGGQVFGLVEQMGVGLEEQVDPCYLIVISAFDSREDKGKEVFVVEKLQCWAIKIDKVPSARTESFSEK